jgi:hypothetical protein
MNVKDIKKGTKMKVKRLALVFLSIAAIMACSGDPVVPVEHKNENGNNIRLRVYVPKGSISTYANEDASAAENRIDTLYVNLYGSKGGTLIESRKFFGGDMTKTGNDSIVDLAFDVNGISTLSIWVEVYANRMTTKVMPDKSEITLPTTKETAFLMTGSNTISKVGSAFTGTVHIVRDVAKLRINISLDNVRLPSDLGIDYSNVIVKVLKTADRTEPVGPVRGYPSGVQYIEYPERKGAQLRPASSFSWNNFTGGGQIDSLYLYENFRNDYTDGTNTTQIEITIPTKSASAGDKTASYVYTLETKYDAALNYNKYDVVRNYIYTLNIKVRGQSLDPLFSVDVQPWNEISVDGSIRGTYLTMQTSEIEFDDSGYAEIGFCTDAQAVYVDYREFNNNNSVQIGNEIKTVNIQPADPLLTPGYQGQVIVDKKVCTSFGFRIDPGANVDPGSFSGNVCIRAGNIVKCISFVGQKIYDAHYIVGDEFLTDTYTSATVLIDPGDNWLEVSPDKLYTTNATHTFTSGTATKLYLHLDEYIPTAPNPAIRKGSIDLVTASGVVKKIYIQQLPALLIGPFGFNNTNDDGLFSRRLYTEQLYEHKTTRPTYTKGSTQPSTNSIYNGLRMARSNYDGSNYGTTPNPATPFNWQATAFEAINYCAYKNRPATKTASGALSANDIKWHLPSQAQLMAMWISYESYKYAPFSNFMRNHSYTVIPGGGISNNIDYWSSTNSLQYPNEAQYMSFIFGNVGYYSRRNETWTRCVRDTVGISSMIDISQGEMDIKFATAMPNASYTNSTKKNQPGDNSDTSAINKTVYYQLRVAVSDFGTNKTWNEAKTICSDLGLGWRLPTQKELQAIWILREEMLIKGTSVSFTDFTEDYYWTATTSSAYTNDAYMEYMGRNPGNNIGKGNTPHIIQTHKASVRCVIEF